MSSLVTIKIDISEQTLKVVNNTGVITNIYSISSAANGHGQKNNSFCTPTGQHIIRAKIGEGQPIGSIFRGRRPTGEIYKTGMREIFPNRDWILTRILWLSGTQPGFNRLGEVDTMRRYIYIHGTPDDVVLGKPGSIGCIRMRNDELLELFDLVSPGTEVEIDA